jgi:hypothetical protein
LLIDAVLDVGLRVHIDVALGLMTLILENSAVDAIVQVEDILRAHSVAIAGIYWVETFLISVFSVTTAVGKEARGFAQHLLLAVVVIAAEVSLNLEGFGVVADADSS